ncbi:hypothetical protein B0T22DRAFT_296010 [Podospora appendiculata]|uniref:Zn(2)-C6 fungal-type domain-containing protein n=1 Tax=Podospora appendiculata TaxID=314037 RepID=A0AAE1C8J9_9PEZI|nr:hypothetical protein B0T22DRAFT_296010 [Podospora appendiculata]
MESEPPSLPPGSGSGRRTGRPRLYHTKSKAGCIRCRERRVKCDESHPVCNNCHRHGVPCHYSRPPAASQPDPRHVNTNYYYYYYAAAVPTSASAPVPQQLSSSQSPPAFFPGSTGSVTGLDDSTSTGSSDVSGPSHDYPQRNQYWMLRGLLNFTVATSHTLPGTHIPSVRECWSVQAPDLALEHEPLLDELLALSALHMIRSRGETETETALNSFRASRLDDALRAHRQSLSFLSHENANATCFTSILLLVDAFATLQDRQLDPYSPPVQWLQIVRGARSVFAASFDMVKNDPSASIMTIVRSSADFTDGTSMFSEVNLQRFPYLVHGDDMGDGRPLGELPPEILDAYRQTVGYIGAVQASIEAGEHPMGICRRLMSLAALIPAPFIDLVEERRPRALIILAHFFAIAAHVTDIWWVGKTPFREVFAIRDNLPASLQHLMAWPLECLAARNATTTSPTTAT